MSAFSRSWNIFRKSLNLISIHKNLLLFPALSAFFILFLILLIIAGGALLCLVFPEASQQKDPELAVQLAFLAIYFVFYLLTMFVSSFCLTAFYHGIYCGMNNQSVSLNRSFSFACSRWKSIFLWSLLASTIGIVLRALEKKSGLLGSIVIKIIGVFWSVASCFAIPVLVLKTELKTPIAVLKESARAIKKTWGESLIGYAGLQILAVVFSFLWVLLTILFLFLCISAASAVCWFLGGLLLFILFVAFLVFNILLNVANHVYRAALYRYAELGDAGIFSESEIESAFKRKGKIR